MYVGKSIEEKELVIGDWVYLKNHSSYDGNEGPWAGEHAIFTGYNEKNEQVFYGHGVEYFTFKEMRVDFLTDLNRQLKDKNGNKKTKEYDIKDIPTDLEINYSP